MNATAADAAIAAEDRYPELLRDLGNAVADSLTGAGVDPGLARAAAESAAELVRELYGGQLVYVPKGHSMQTRRRWQALWDEFDGSNQMALARKYGMSYQRVYRVLKIMQEQHRKRVQAELPGLEG
jgi:Mor family transcriptional regulator